MKKKAAGGGEVRLFFASVHRLALRRRRRSRASSLSLPSLIHTHAGPYSNRVCVQPPDLGPLCHPPPTTTPKVREWSRGTAGRLTLRHLIQVFQMSFLAGRLSSPHPLQAHALLCAVRHRNEEESNALTLSHTHLSLD